MRVGSGSRTRIGETTKLYRDRGEARAGPGESEGGIARFAQKTPGARALMNELQRVSLVLLHHDDAAATDPRQLVSGLLEELRLDVIDPDRDVGR